MQYPQILLYDADDPLVNSMRTLADERRWIVRDFQRAKACLENVGTGGLTVVIVRLGRDLERELTLVRQCVATYPEASVIVVGDLEHPHLAGLAWDLGASYVLFPPQERELLGELVAGFLSDGSG